MGVIFKNNVMYGAGDIEISPVCYSEEEREVGCWVDGKPLYEKTLHFTTTSSTNTYISVPHNISDADIIFIHNAFVQSPSVSFILSGYRGNAEANEFIGLLNNMDNTFDYKCGSSTINSNAYIILRYTKTTDQPGSGTWTPSGVPAVHYSENEQVVGTWVDGSTLYERTYTGISFEGTSDTTIVDANIKSNSGIYNVKSITGLWSIGNFGYSDATTQAFGETGIFNGGSQTLYARVTPNGLAVVRTNTYFGYGAFLTVQYTKSTS